MHPRRKIFPIVLFYLGLMMLGALQTIAQPLSGVWRGKVTIKEGILPRSFPLELHWERNNDSLRGIAYYYQSKTRYAVTRIEGYVDPGDGTVRWVDLEQLEGNWTPPGRGQLTYTADVNCPGEGIITLDGPVAQLSRREDPMGTVHLDKVSEPIFPAAVVATPTKPAVSAAPVVSAAPAPQLPKAQTIEEMYTERKKVLVTTIPVTGDSIEVSFYDHAEIDGDSISLFVDGKLHRNHILLKATPFTLHFAVAELKAETEITMVAENLGSIPPNTSLMVAYIQGVRHEARLESTENSSAMIRLVKAPLSGGSQGGQR